MSSSVKAGIDTLPFITGLLVQGVGSLKQYLDIRRLRSRNAPGELVQRVFRDGDVTQFICTFLAVAPPALYIWRNREVLFLSLLAVAFAALVLVLVVIARIRPPTYWRYKLGFVTILFCLAVACCLFGLVVALESS